MPEADLDLLIEAAKASGDIALKYFQSDPQVWEKDAGAGPVTEADLAVNAMLEHELRAARPDYGWLSEESADTPDRLGAERVFIIDPIDGTRSFIEGHATWAHSLAIAEAGRIIAGVILLPVRDQLYTARLGNGAHLNGNPMAATNASEAQLANVLAARPVLDAKHWHSGIAPDFKRHHRPSLAYRMALVANGDFDGMLTLRPSWEWDIAAGALIVSEAGAQVTDRSGAELRFNAPRALLDGVVAAPRALHAEFISSLAPR